MISIIMPVYNLASHLKKVLRHTLDLHGDFEVIAVDGGSIDKSLDILQSFPEVKIYHASKGRSLQMNKGAQHAKGNILLFLHADSFLPENGLLQIEELMKDPTILGGSFYLKFDQSHPVLKIYSLFSRINHSLFTYGDQALFCRTSVFQAIGGYKDIPLMEDVEIQFRMRKIGEFVKLSNAVTTSARRFKENGLIRQMLVDIALLVMYKLGASPYWLKRFYPDK
jgi:rSAM/selenodomain-associated transferase 2